MKRKTKQNKKPKPNSESTRELRGNVHTGDEAGTYWDIRNYLKVKQRCEQKFRKVRQKQVQAIQKK